MGASRDWNNMYGTKLLGGSILYTANEHGNGAEHDATALPKDHEGGPEDGYGGEEDAAAPLDGYGGEEDATGPLEDHDSDQDDRGADLESSDNDIVPFARRALQLLAIRANFPIRAINGYDRQLGRRIYWQREGEVQKEGMVDLVPVGPRKILMAYGGFGLEVFHCTTTTGHEGSRVGSHIKEECDVCGNPIKVEWDVCDGFGEEPEEYTQTICGGPGRMLEITYLVISNAIATNVEVKLKLRDLGSRSRAVYGKIKASASDYGNKSVHLFSYERGMSWSVPSGPTSILPLSPSVIAVPSRRQLELHIDVDLTVITTFDSEEEDKNLKSSLKFARGIRTQEREVADVQVEVNIIYDEIWI